MAASSVAEDESAAAVAVAPGGFPVVAGDSAQGAGDADVRYVSYDAITSNWRWNAVPLTWAGSGGGVDKAAGVAVDAAGDAYVAGTTASAGAGNDVVLLKVLGVGSGGSSSGQLLWPQTYDAPAHGDD